MLDAAQAVSTEDFQCPSGTGTLSARLYLPASAPRTAVVIHGATGVPRDYYQHFARWLADTQGMACLTYDYSDFGHSLNGPLKESRVEMADWALIDMPAARAEMRRRFPGAQQWSIGHSVGGMLGPIQPDVDQIDRMICVCAGPVTVSDHPWPYRALALLFWYGHAPLCGESPGISSWQGAGIRGGPACIGLLAMAAVVYRTAQLPARDRDHFARGALGTVRDARGPVHL